MLVTVPLPLKSDGVPPKFTEAGFLTLDIPGFGTLLQVPREIAGAVKARIGNSLTTIGVEIKLAEESDPYNGIWLREMDFAPATKGLLDGIRNHRDAAAAR